MTKSTKIKQGLGKGLGALIPSMELEHKERKSSDEVLIEEQNILVMVDLNAIHLNPYQPRQDFDSEALEDLKNSIVKHGVISPITISKSIHGYELISGERRLRASKMAGLQTIPAYVLEIDSDAKRLELALIENVQRQDLNPIEIAHGYKRLIEECKYTQEQVAEQIGKDRSTIANFMRLLRLPEKIQESVRSKELSMGHARTLLGLTDHIKMLAASKEIIDKNLSVRATEQLVKDIETGKKSFSLANKNKKTSLDAHLLIHLNALTEQLKHRFSTQVKIHAKSKDSGKIELEFYSSEDLDRIIEILLENDN